MSSKVTVVSCLTGINYICDQTCWGAGHYQINVMTLKQLMEQKLVPSICSGEESVTLQTDFNLEALPLSVSATWTSVVGFQKTS